MKLNWGKVLLLMALALFAVPVLMLGLTGKYRLLMKPLHVDASKKNAAILKAPPNPVATGNESSRVSGKGHSGEYLENILKMYTVDFYPSVERPGSTDGNNPAPGDFRTGKRPAVEIPDSVRPITGIDNDKSYGSRIYDVSRLSRNLSDRELTALLYFMHKKAGDDVLPPLEFNAVKNDVATAIMNQERNCGEFAPHLIAMYYDKSFDDVWRDYCVQFLGQCYGKIEIPQQREIVRNLFSDALKDRGGIPGAALIAMSGLADNPEFGRGKIAEEAYALFIAGKTDDMIKATAMQVCAKLKKREILPLARELIRTSKNVPLKMSAVAAVGAMGDNSDLDTLRSLAKNSDVRMRTASKAALKKMGIN